MLDVIDKEPRRAADRAPVLFVHGAWHGAWCRTAVAQRIRAWLDSSLSAEPERVPNGRPT